MRTAIALGSNLGDRMANLARGRKTVEQAGTGPFLISPVYETEPVDCPPGSPAYLNAVMEFDFNGRPNELLTALQRAEAAAGRPQDHGYHTPRPLDLDILYMEDVAINETSLQIPHPRLHLRRFVLQPLSDIRPDLVLPGFDMPVKSLLALLTPEPKVHFYDQSF